MRVRWILLVCAAVIGAGSVWLLAACTTPAAELRFTGTAYPVVASADDIEVIEGSKPPPGHRVIGVATASCATLNGTTGVLADGPCNREAMLALLREKAAAVGGQAIVDPQCGDNVMEREIETRDGGYTKTTTRELTTCQATVTRRRSGAVAVTTATSAAAPSGEPMQIGDARVVVRFERSGTTTASPRDESAVGEMEDFPADYPSLGMAIAECETACARSAARRALKKRAAAAGALAIARLHCELLGQRWRCQAQLVGQAAASTPEEPVDAGAEGGEVADAATDGAQPPDDAGEAP